MLTTKDKLFIIKQVEHGHGLINPMVEKNGPAIDEWAFTIMYNHTTVVHRGTKEECIEFEKEAHEFVEQIREARDKLTIEEYRRMGVDI